jgi:hypothetical protein
VGFVKNLAGNFSSLLLWQISKAHTWIMMNLTLADFKVALFRSPQKNWLRFGKSVSAVHPSHRRNHCDDRRRLVSA